MLWAPLRCRRRLLGDDELPEQHAEGRGLHRVRMDCQEVIAEGALLVVPDPVGFESVLPAGDAGAGPRVPVGSMIAEPADDVGWRV